MHNCVLQLHWQYLSDKIFWVLIDSYSSKKLIHVCCNSQLPTHTVNWWITYFFSHWNNNMYQFCSINKYDSWNLIGTWDWWPPCAWCWFWQPLIQHHLWSRFLEKCSFHLDYDHNVSVGWWMIYSSMSHLNYSPTFIIYLYLLWSFLNRNMIDLAIPVTILMQLTSLIPNMNRQTSMVILLNSITPHWISNMISFMFHPNTRNCLIFLLEATYTKGSHWT